MRKLRHRRPAHRHDDGLLVIDVPGGTVQIRTGLKDERGRDMTTVRVLPHDRASGGDERGVSWSLRGCVESALIREERSVPGQRTEA